MGHYLSEMGDFRAEESHKRKMAALKADLKKIDKAISDIQLVIGGKYGGNFSLKLRPALKRFEKEVVYLKYRHGLLTEKRK